MTVELRTTLYRWLIGLMAIIGTILLWPILPGLNLSQWLLRASFMLLLPLALNMGLKTTYGKGTFLPALALTALLTLGIRHGMAFTTVGIILGSLIELARVWARRKQEGIWHLLGEIIWWPLGLNSISLVGAAGSYWAFGNSPPLTAITRIEDLSPIITAPVVYLLIYNFLHLIDFWLRSLPIIQSFVQNRRTMLGIQLLPMVPVPFSALVLANQGLVIFAIFEIIIATIIIVINRLTVTQDSLNVQIDQLRTFSAMNRALRTTLNVDDLLQTTYYQAANLLRMKNIQIVINRTPDSDDPTWQTRLTVEDGKRKQISDPESLDGMMTKMLEDHVAILADPLDGEARKLSITGTPENVRAWMGVPMMASGKVLGGIAMWLMPGQQTDRILNDDDLEMLAALAGQTSVAVENALLYRDAQTQATQLEQLNEISTVMNASLNPERVMELIANSVMSISGCHKAAIYLAQPGSGSSHLLLVHSTGFSPENLLPVKDANLTLTEAQRDKLMEQGKTLIVPDVEEMQRMMAPGLLLLAEQEKFSSFTYLPLRAQNQSIGLLAIYYNEPHTYRSSDIELLETFANQAALAIVNARIYQQVDVELTRRVEQSVHMADVTSRLSSTLDLKTIFDLIVDTAMDGCDADAGILVLNQDPDHLVDDEAGEVSVVAWKGFDAPHSKREGAEAVANQVLQSGRLAITTLDDPDDLAGPRSQLSVPIVVDNRTIGAIALESERINAFTAEDVTFVSQLAVQASVAIRNAQLYRRAQQVRDRLHAILDASHDGLMMIDQHSRITMTNTRMGDFWDFARQDFSQRSPDQFLADPLTALGEGLGYKAGELKELIAEGQQNRNMRPVTDLYEARSGRRTRYVERMASPVYDEHSEFIGLLLVFRDVTEQKELEQAREDLTSMIVHDLRAPLQAVMGGMRAVETRVKDDDVVKQATDMSGRAVKKLLNLVNNLLDMSRVDSGELQIDTTPANMRKILEDAAEELKPISTEVNAVIEVETPDDLPSVLVDQDMISRVVLNLIDNALKYAPPGSLVHVRAEPENNGSHVKVQVIDRGPGVPEDYKQSIFDRFSQVPGQKGRRRSAGLGLAFCQIAIETHNGRIWVEDNPPGGSIFQFTVPAAADKEEEPPGRRRRGK